MKARDFYDLVVSMRQAQKDFYKSKGQDWNSVRKPLWDKSLELEKQVDAEIARVTAILNSHGN